MSKVYSFRLDEDNPREKKALKILLDYRQKGYSIRITLTDALLKLDETRNSEMLQEDKILLRKIEELFGKIPIHLLDEGNTDEKSISTRFVEALKKTAKSGLSIKP